MANTPARKKRSPEEIEASRNRTEEHEKFKKLASQRTSTALRAINAVGKLGQPRAYTWTEEDSVKIAEALKAAVVKAVENLNPNKAKASSKPEFTL